MITISNLVKQYGRFTAVDDISLDVKPGEIHGFLGPNGAGKTTTLRMIAGLLKPTSGRVIVNGHDVAAEPELAKGSLGFIPDRPFIYEKLTAGEFLKFHAGLYGLDGDGVMDRVHEMLELFELRRWENELVESFSHGMKQRLVMCAAFLHRPRAVARAFLFGGVGIGVFCALFYGAAWLTWQLEDYEELGDYLLRLGLSWIFMTFLAFLTFSGIVTALSTFFLSDDLRLLLTAPIAARRLFYARFARTVGQPSWMVVVFIAPVLPGVGPAPLAPA